MPVIKSYASAETAQKIAAKKSTPDAQYVVVESNGKYEVVLSNPVSVETASVTQPSSETSDNLSAATDLMNEADDIINETPPTQKVMHGSTVTLEIDGAKLTAQYVITPVLGSKPRWFERKRLDSAEAIQGGVRITCNTKELTSRGLGHLLAQLDTKANEEPAPIELQTEHMGPETDAVELSVPAQAA
jgi:hypothetical protein